MVQLVEEFAKPVEDFKDDVTKAENRQTELNFKLTDLHNRAEIADKNLSQAKLLNFRNSDPAATYKTEQIKRMIAASEGNIR